MSSTISVSVTPGVGSKLVRSAFSGLVVTLLTNAFLFGGQLLIPRLLTRVEYAQFTVSISFVAVSALLADLGMTSMFTRMLAQAEEAVAAGQHDERGKLLGSMIALRTGLAILVSVLVAIIAPKLYAPDMVGNIYVLILTLFVSSRLIVVRSVGDAFLRSRGKYHVAAAFNMFDAVAFVALIVFANSNAGTLRDVVWIYACCNIPGFVMLLWTIGRTLRNENIRLGISPVAMRSMLRTALPLSIGTAFLTIHTEADKLLLDKLSNPMEVSSFGATMRLFAALSPVSMVVSAVASPELTKLLHRGDLKRARHLIDLSLRVLLTIAGGVALFLTVASNETVMLLLGGKYASAGPLLAYVGWMLLPIFFASFMTEVSIAAGEFWHSTVYSAIIMAVVLSGDLILAGPYGAYGATIAKMSALVAGCAVLFAMQLRKEFIDRESSLRSLSRIALALLFAGATFEVLMTIEVAHLGIAVGTLATYLLAIHFLHVLHFRELRSLVTKLRVKG